MPDFTFVTYADLPDLDPDDRLAVVEVERRGASVGAQVWSDAAVDWSSAGTVVIRSTWDYHLHHDAFLAWVDRVAEVTSIWNPPSLVRRNSVKTYLKDLEERGVPVVPPAWIDKGKSCDLPRVMRERAGGGGRASACTCRRRCAGASRFAGCPWRRHGAAREAGGLIVPRARARAL